VLEEICAASTEDCKRFMSSNESDLVTLLLESVVSTNPPSIAVSLRCKTVDCVMLLVAHCFGHSTLCMVMQSVSSYHGSVFTHLYPGLLVKIIL